ncbi:MAG: glycosyltransferase family 2 protein [Flavobacteriaceae bacterium]
MRKIAALLTCHNRKEKTLRCLEHLYTAKGSQENILLSVYLTDDGSTDGTYDAVSKEFPEVTILKGNGNLFWAKGMNNSWTEALKKEYDGYLLINDDTFVESNLFHQITTSEAKCLEKYGRKGVYVGTTYDESSKSITYGGSIILNRFLYTSKRLDPNGDIQACHLSNANILYVDASVISEVGILSKGYAHGIADYDYSLKCVRKKLPVIIMPDFNGICEYDHKDMYHDFASKSLKDRVSYLYNPRGIDFKSRVRYMKKFFPFRFPFFYTMGWLKVLFPKFYLVIFRNR